MPDRAYAAHQALIAPARPSAALWRLAIGSVVIAGLAFFLSTMFQMGLVTFAPNFWNTLVQSNAAPGLGVVSMFLILGSFGFVTLAVAICVRLVHARSLGTVLGPNRVLITQFWSVFRWLFAIGALVLALTSFNLSEPLQPNLSLGLWLLLLPASLLAVFVQTSAEEILFRGYLQQQLAARFSSPWVWMVIPSAIFAVGHYLPIQAGDNAFLIALWSGVFGLMMADITARAGTLGPAIAIHFANNVSALLVVALSDNLNGLALYTVPYTMSDTQEIRALLPVDFAAMFVAWLAARVAIRR